ncbi:hypothetical protein SDC9_123058 [bioreactor metagenome]|uniref:Uncharacterized protein n=1 Tax=bioreactor metagenome TaxID=1076179 RepID=A0A645CGM6_9ZZZZ
MKRGVVRSGPPVGGIALLVVLCPVVVKSVGDLVGDHIAHSSQILLVGSVHIIKWLLQNGCGEGNRVVDIAVAGIHSVRRHGPIGLVHSVLLILD